MSEEDWRTSFVRCFGVELFGRNIDVNEHGEAINGDTLLLLFNADHGGRIDFTVPAGPGEGWELILDTARAGAELAALAGGAKYALEPCSLALFRLVTLTRSASKALGLGP